MIIKSFELNKIDNRNKFFLFYGENEGLKEDLILEFSKDYSKENTFKYSEKEIFLNLENFYNNIFSQSFFEKKKLIIVNNTTEKVRSEIELILTKNIEDITLIFLSNILEKKSKLRKFECFKSETHYCTKLLTIRQNTYVHLVYISVI